MKKSELQKELEIAKVTLELAMVALRLASEKNKKLEEKEPQAGDKIVEDNKNDDWFIKNDDGTYTIKLDASKNITRWTKDKDDSNLTGWNEPIQKEPEHPDYICIKDYKDWIKKGSVLTYYTGYDKHEHKDTYVFYNNTKNLISKEIIFNSPEYFQKVEPKKETPLSDLNAEVQREQEEQEKYTKLANELVKHFRPLVNGWTKCSPFDTGAKILEEPGNGKIDQSFWKRSISDYNKTAIKIAIKHCELIINDSLFMECKKYSNIKECLEKML